MFTGPQKLAVDVDEMAVAGGAAGEAIRMTRCRTIDLDVPADSEIVVEGLIDPTCSSPKRRSARATAMSRSKPTTCRSR